MKFSFRPHHFLCTLGFQGKGYSPGFIKNYSQIVEALQENQELPLEVARGLDSICDPCPHHKRGLCQFENKVQSLDARHSRVLNIKEGDVLTWREAQKRLKEKMTLTAFHQACKGCTWKASGVCETALKKLRNDPL